MLSLLIGSRLLKAGAGKLKKTYLIQFSLRKKKDTAAFNMEMTGTEGSLYNINANS